MLSKQEHEARDKVLRQLIASLLGKTQGAVDEMAETDKSAEGYDGGEETPDEAEAESQEEMGMEGPEEGEEEEEEEGDMKPRRAMGVMIIAKKGPMGKPGFGRGKKMMG